MNQFDSKTEFTCEKCHFLVKSTEPATEVFDYHTVSSYYYHAECADRLIGDHYDKRTIR